MFFLIPRILGLIIGFIIAYIIIRIIYIGVGKEQLYRQKPGIRQFLGRSVLGIWAGMILTGFCLFPKRKRVDLDYSEILGPDYKN